MTGTPKGAAWIGDPLDHIEARQSLIGEKIDNAVVLIRNGFHAESCTFDNVAFVCHDAETAREVAQLASPERVIVGGMAEAVALLAVASVTTK